MVQPERRGTGRPAVRNDYGGSQESRVRHRTIRPTSEVAQVFYVKDMSTKPKKRKERQEYTSYDEPKRHIVLLGKRNIMGVEDKTDMSEDYNKFDDIPPFKVKTDPSIILNNEDCLLLRRNYKKGKHTKKTQKTSYIGIITCVSQYGNHFCVMMLLYVRYGNHRNLDASDDDIGDYNIRI